MGGYSEVHECDKDLASAEIWSEKVRCNLSKTRVRLGGRHNMPPPLLTVGQRVCKFKGVSKEILRVF